ncbi:hypothetical protein FIV42_16635 [Persicimonas caeni]|uniref:Uncharacterized protein n=1 Tax=Persicimonas caeni TaxID=2292766 RepID=A0A4Y6PX27_PERCE|nr:hypothetical protein [Persicimonas caeni]QDG52305.1 hypothetical protein FIV42_16635 [Persicimonas caeni]QED33527.1 hypothetical protein FRD00_16630 [Persicimonas caeni]
MSESKASSREPIWQESRLRAMVRDTGRSAQTRSWALDRLARMLGEQAVVPLAVDMLADEEPHVAANALTMLESAGRKECSEAVAAFSTRDDVPHWSKRLSTVLLASCGDEEACQTAFGSPGAVTYFELWAERDPHGFSEAACAFWSDRLAHNPDFLAACTTAATAELAAPLLETLGKLDTCDPNRDDLLVRLMARAGFGLPELGADMPIEWHPSQEDIFSSRVDPSMLEERCDELAELVAQEDWKAVSRHCLDTIGSIGESGARELDAPPLDWAFVLAGALDEHPQRIPDDYMRAQLSFALQEAVLLVFDIEATLDERDGLEPVLDLYGWSIGTERDRLEEMIEARWTGSDDQRELVTQWLDRIDDEFEWFDALQVASRLDGYDVTPCLSVLVDEMEDERAGYDIDWAAETLICALERQPGLVADEPDRLLLGGAVVSDSALLALATVPYTWASRLILERFDKLASTEENEVLWETLSELADPDSLEPLMEQWEPGEYRLAHAIAFVADVAGRLDELPDGIKKDLDELSSREARYEKRLEAMISGDGDLSAALPDGGPLELSLRCTECDTVSDYTFRELYLDREREVDLRDPFAAVLFDRIVECPNCGAVDSVEPTERAEHRLAAMIAALADAERWPEDSPLQVWHPELWDGTTFRTPREGIEHLEAQANAQPDRPEPWRRLGHFCVRFHADAKAKEAYEHADRLDGRGVPDPDRLRDLGIPTEPVGPDEAKALLAEHSHRHAPHPGDGAKLASYELHECLVSENWRDVEKLASVFVSRKVSEDKYVAAAFLVDLGSQGVKEVIFASSLGPDRYSGLKKRLQDIHGNLESSPPELAARILDTAVRFALALGFFPPDDYFAAREMLAEYDPDAAGEDVPTGEQGLPLYVGDPDAFEPVVEQIYRRTGPDGFASI